MTCRNTTCTKHLKDLGSNKFCPNCGQKTVSSTPQSMTCFSTDCSYQGQNLVWTKFCPECGAATMPPDQWHDGQDAPCSNHVDSGLVENTVEVFLSSAIRQVFCFIPAGSFFMGSPSGERDRFNDENQVEVMLSRPFWLAKTAVTQAQWESVMGSNPSGFKGAGLPVENVSWEDAQAYIMRLNEKQILPAGWRFALPTEAQWEYACRAGVAGPCYAANLGEAAWFDENSGSKTHEVGQKRPNAWGLRDMLGNVWEWCADWYDGRLTGGMDPVGPASGSFRVRRGGSWNDLSSICRAASRMRHFPGVRNNYLGIRLAVVN